MSNIKDKHNTIIKTVDTAKTFIQSLLNDIDEKENDYHANVQKYEVSYSTRSKELEESYTKRVEELERTAEATLKTYQETYAQKLKALADEKQQWDIEKQLIANTHTFESRIKLDVGGCKFTTTLTTLTRFPDSMIGTMFSGRHNLTTDESGYYFIDRDGTHFRHILNYLRCPEDFDVSSISADHLKELKKEAVYYGLDEKAFSSPEIETTDKNGSTVVLRNINGIWNSTCWGSETSICPIYYCRSCKVGTNTASCSSHSCKRIKNFDSYVPAIDKKQPSPSSCCCKCTRRH